MKLEDLLKKNKFKADKEEYTLKPVSIATEDRPYIDKPRPNLGQSETSQRHNSYQCPTVTSVPQSLVSHSHQCPIATSVPQLPDSNEIATRYQPGAKLGQTSAKARPPLNQKLGQT